VHSSYQVLAVGGYTIHSLEMKTFQALELHHSSANSPDVKSCHLVQAKFLTSCPAYFITFPIVNPRETPFAFTTPSLHKLLHRHSVQRAQNITQSACWMARERLVVSPLASLRLVCDQHLDVHPQRRTGLADALPI